ncbi:endonuclease I family protein [Pleomorphovibrio marinus]|uniref:endonuclease I family protein n=1 Tax=Pleomorphovibrio marinus TaxID=2164132 RepID=UPI000E0A67E7|nr:endonuclease [Pleomorphovibrio marinus]
MRGKGWVLVWLCYVAFLPIALAEYLETRRNIGIKDAPLKEANVIYAASEGEIFPLLHEGHQSNGYYGIKLPNGTTGYVYRTMVILHRGELPSKPLPDSVPLSIENYYPDSLTRLEGETLKSALHQRIRNHKVFKYDETWDILCKTDQDPENPDQVILIYTKRTQPAVHRDRGTRFDYEKNGYTLIDAWNREHIWPKSHGFPNPSDTAFTDLHHLRPADRSVNSARNTRSFDTGEMTYFDNGNTVPTLSKTHTTLWCWEPPDEVKGDIARMIFYMAVRYEGPDYDLEVVDEVIPRNNQLPHIGRLSTLLEWHHQDPVDEWEKSRNELIYTNYQGNRNPFIDFPEWVEKIWK